MAIPAGAITVITTNSDAKRYYEREGAVPYVTVMLQQLPEDKIDAVTIPRSPPVSLIERCACDTTAPAKHSAQPARLPQGTPTHAGRRERPVGTRPERTHPRTPLPIFVTYR